MKNVLLALCGSIAGVRAKSVKTALEAEKMNVRCILSSGAKKLFKQPDWAEKSTLFDAGVSAKEYRNGHPMRHIELAKWADLIIVYGATASTLSRLSNGMSDDLVSLAYLASSCPKVVVPAMNPTMWNAAPTQRNWQQVLSDGAWGASPINGKVACGDCGIGHVADTENIVSLAKKLTTNQPLLDKHIIITGGSARVPVDPIRYIANHSSGTMASALAQVATELGAAVSYISPPDAKRPKAPHKWHKAITNNDFATAVKSIQKADYILHLAALSDFKITHKADKMDSKQAQKINLQPAPKLISQLQKWFPNAITIGWKAADLATMETAAEALMKRENLYAVVANPLSTMGSATAECTIFLQGSKTQLYQCSKIEMAQKLWDIFSKQHD